MESEGIKVPSVCFVVQSAGAILTLEKMGGGCSRELALIWPGDLTTRGREGRVTCALTVRGQASRDGLLRSPRKRTRV